jgi:hypothetical protein
MGVILTEYVTDDRRALSVWAPGAQARLEHCVQDAAVYRLEPVSHVRQGALHDHTHGIIEERLPHLIFNETGYNAVQRLFGRRARHSVFLWIPGFRPLSATRA